MNKIKKLIPIMLLSSLFVNVPNSVIAMDNKISSNSTVLSVNEVNELYKNSKFNSVNLYKQICREYG